MRRIGRWILNGVTALSLVLCAGAWIESRLRARQVAYYGTHATVFATLDSGNIMCELQTGDFAGGPTWYRGSAPPGGFGDVAAWTNSSQTMFSRLGFAMVWRRATPTSPLPAGSVSPREIFLSAPIWLPMIAFAAPAVFIQIRRRARRNHVGACQACGYDLTGNVSGVCPECGTAVANH